MPKAFITGASAGIGAAVAQELHTKGYDLVLFARRKDTLAQMCDQFNAVRPESSSYYSLDLGAASDLARAEEIIRSSKIDLLVNNVGKGSFGSLESLSIEDEEYMVRLNVIVPLRLTHAVIPQMKERQSGGIIFLSSVAAFQPLPYLSTYAATKSFNFSQAISLRRELKPCGVQVLAVCPGPTATEFGGVARVPGTMTGMHRDSAESVAKKTVAAFERGDSYVVTGFMSKVMACMSRIAPYSFSTWLLSRGFKSVLKSAQPKS